MASRTVIGGEVARIAEVSGCPATSARAPNGVGYDAARVFDARGHGAIDAVDTPVLGRGDLQESPAAYRASQTGGIFGDLPPQDGFRLGVKVISADDMMTYTVLDYLITRARWRADRARFRS